MDERVKEEYDRILTKAIIENGQLIAKNPSGYGWTCGDDYDQGSSSLSWRGPRHIMTCGLFESGEVIEDATWYEFAGTDAPSCESRKIGMEVREVTCNCGRLEDRTYRWEAPAGEAIRVVMEALLLDRVEKAEEDS